CHLPSGKNLWLCDAHRKAERITVLSDDIGEVSAEVIDSTNFLNIKQSSTSKQANAVMNIVARKAQAASNKKGIKASAKVVASTNSANILAPKSKACMKYVPLFFIFSTSLGSQRDGVECTGYFKKEYVLLGLPLLRTRRNEQEQNLNKSSTRKHETSAEECGVVYSKKKSKVR
ncbi:hypothetical protein CAPTEDRAFT_207584, partial [Capitella teleta]